MNGYQLKIFSGNSNEPLARSVCEILGQPLSEMRVGRFSDGEINVHIKSNIRGADVFVIQPTGGPIGANEAVMELLVVLDAMKRSSARRVTAVIPYYGYARQDRKNKPRVPITAKLVADLLFAAGAQRVVAFDLHAGQIQGFFDIPVDHLQGAPVLLGWLNKQKFDDPCIVSPDAGGVERARFVAERINAPLAIIDKRRDDSGAEALNLIGDIKGRTAIIIDDMGDTFGSVVSASKLLAQQGALSVYACVVHGVLSGPALERIAGCEILKKVVVTDTVQNAEKAAQCDKIEILTVAPILAEAISRIHKEESVSSLFI